MNPLLLKIGGPLMIAALFMWWHAGQVGTMQNRIDTAVAAQEFAEDQLDEFRRADVRAKAVAISEMATALQASQREFERQLAQERELRAAAERQVELQARRAVNADKRIEELKNEDAEIREWGATPIPVEWVDFMHDALAESAGGLSGAGDNSRSGDQVAAAARRAEYSHTNPESG